MYLLNSDLLAIARCATQFRNERLAPFGLKSCHASYLFRICAEPGISQDKLAQYIYFNKSNVARQSAILEEDGFIIRKPSQADKRVLELYPTEKTLELLPQIREILKEWDAIISKDLTPEEYEAVAQILCKMRAHAGEWMEGR